MEVTHEDAIAPITALSGSPLGIGNKTTAELQVEENPVVVEGRHQSEVSSHLPLPLSKGMYVIVKYDDAPFMGIVLDVDSYDVKVKCMTNAPNSLTFTWPKKMDVCWYAYADVLSIASPISIRRGFFTLDEKFWASINKRL